CTHVSMPDGQYSLSLHAALPIWTVALEAHSKTSRPSGPSTTSATVSSSLSSARWVTTAMRRSELWETRPESGGSMPVSTSSRVVDRKSTLLNSSHVKISYAVFCS